VLSLPSRAKQVLFALLPTGDPEGSSTKLGETTRMEDGPTTPDSADPSRGPAYELHRTVAPQRKPDAPNRLPGDAVPRSTTPATWERVPVRTIPWR
jgi:hypothetical protein